jgi:hypothetical protein
MIVIPGRPAGPSPESTPQPFNFGAVSTKQFYCGVWIPGPRASRVSRNDESSYFVTFSKNSTSALRSSAEPIVCSGILVPGV